MVSSRDREREMSGQSPEDFPGSENTLCDTIMVDTRLRMFSKSKESTTPRVNLNITWVVVMCRCRLISC